MMNNIKVSVVMPVYNAEPFLRGHLTPQSLKSL